MKCTDDPSALAEARIKASQFAGATSISSDQYFGRDVQSDQINEQGLPQGSFAGNDSLASMEAAARGALSRVMANPDVQNAADSIRANALKV